MAEQEAHAFNAVHPAEGKCLMIDFIAGVQVTLDCTDFHNRGVMIRIFNRSANLIGYKFSPSAVANISIGATGGANACSRIPANQSDRAAIPRGMPYLHLQSPVAAQVYISEASDIR